MIKHFLTLALPGLNEQVAGFASLWEVISGNVCLHDLINILSIAKTHILVPEVVSSG